jgi:hypothetical protein
MNPDDLIDKLKKHKEIKKMEERIKLLEGKIEVLLNSLTRLEDTVKKIDQALGVVFQHMMVEKTFFDALQVNKPPEQSPTGLITPEVK